MVNRTHLALKANDRSYFAILKKEIHVLAQSAGFSDSKVGEIDIVVAELVSNLSKHAQNGRLFVRLFEKKSIQGLELICMDDGPGMADVRRMMADGVSTKNTLGTGLGAIHRLSDIFQCYSVKGWGTISLIRFFTRKEDAFTKPPPVQFGAVVVPKPEETACGDGAYITQNSHYVKIMLGDGLGHGPDAAKAVEAAGAAFLSSALIDPAELIREMHTAVKRTRGLVATVAVFDITAKLWRICGVGNVGARLQGPGFYKNYVPYNGIVGLNLPGTMNVQELPYEKEQCLIMASDGLKSRWDTSKYYGIGRYDPSILAASLLKDYVRGTDDASVAVCRIN